MTMAKIAVCLTNLLILTLIGVGNSASTEKDQDKISPRLTNGSLVSLADYEANANGAASIAVAELRGNSFCLAVLTSTTQFLSGCRAPFNHVYVGSRYYPTESAFDGNVLAVTAGPTVQSPASFFAYAMDTIPSDSRAKAALVYPNGTAPPMEGATCLLYGYSSTTSPFMLNSRPAIVTSVTTCNATYPSMEPGIEFCAVVSDDNGNEAVCPPRDTFSIVLCRGWVPSAKGDGVGQPASSDKGSLTRFCLLNGNSPFCAWLCAWNHYCAATHEEDTPSVAPWYVAGIEASRADNCGSSHAKPILYDLVLHN